jgi:hypothetical protein
MRTRKHLLILLLGAVSALLAVGAQPQRLTSAKSVSSQSAAKLDSAPTTIAAYQTQPEWARFFGKARRTGDRYTLTDRRGGSIEMAASDVRLERGGVVRVKIGVPAKILKAPQILSATEITALRSESALAIPPAANADCDCTSPGRPCCQQCTRQEDCPSRCAACIGLVRVCCGSGGTRGICFGVWSCPG